MKLWQFSEQSFHPGWAKTPGPIRIEPPNRLIDPNTASDLLNRYLDEWCAGDELGYSIMVNEHHTSMSSITPSCNMNLAILARQTKKARLLCLGVPMTNRIDPLRIAEEMALIDVLSRGRLEIGLVKGVPWELYSSNQNPVGLMDRFWEGHDFIIKALTTQEGPFSWEGKYFDYRTVNIFPRCFQQPRPQFWMPGSSPGTARAAARRDHVFATFLAGHDARIFFEAYKDEYLKVHGRPAPVERLAYLAMGAVGADERDAEQRALAMRTYLPTLMRIPSYATNPPGYLSTDDMVRSMMDPNARPQRRMSNGVALPAEASLEQLADAGVLLNGTPEQVQRQIIKFHDAVGGFGNFILMGQAGWISHEDTVDNLRLFANEVFPHLDEHAHTAQVQVA